MHRNFKIMIIVWNNNHGDMYGFRDIDEYKEWIMKNKNEIDGFDNSVYDVKTGEKCTDENQVDLHEWNCNVLYPYGA